MGTSSSSIFNGASRYSQDFQNVISRAVSIASLPLNLLNSQKTDLANRSGALSSLDRSFSSLQMALEGVQGVLGSASLASTVSDSSKATVTIADGAMEGNYSIDIQDIGAYSTMMTGQWDGTPGTEHSYKLYIGAAEYDIDPADNSAASVAAAINTQYGDKVRATKVNVNPAGNDYRIALQSTTLGDAALDIKDDGDSLAVLQTDGRQAHYLVNNSGVDVYSSSRSVTISDGLTVHLLASDTDNPVEITVARSAGALSGALSAFAAAYNNAVSALDQQGQSDGALGGDAVLLGLSQVLRGLATYGPQDPSLPDMMSLGLELDKEGNLTLDESAFASAFASNSAGILAFLGSSASGGFLKTATDGLNSVENSDTGLLETAETSVTDQTTRLTNQISDEQARVNDLQTRLQQQMAEADALIATMEQQYNYISQMFQAMQTAANQYK